MRLAVAFIVVASALVVPQAGAQLNLPPLLVLNGQTDAPVALGETMAITLLATPNVPFLIAFSTDPGPVQLFGRTIPIGDNGAVVITHSNLLMPPFGIFGDGFVVPMIPSLLGFNFYGVALTIDGAQPAGIGVSNQVQGQIVMPPSAGPDTAGWSDTPIVLDGSQNRDPSTDALPPGVTLSWSILSGPANHGATLQNAQTQFPTLRASVAGSYQIGCAVSYPGTTGSLSDSTTVSVYGVTTSLAQGSFNTANPLGLAATLTGPTRQSYGFSGGTPAGGNTAVISGPAGTPYSRNLLELVSTSGQYLGRGHTIVNNVGTTFGAPPPSSFAFNLKQAAINDVAMVLETLLEAADLDSLVLGQPPVNIANVGGLFGITTFSANVQLTSLSYNPNITITLTPISGAAHATITLTNVVMVFHVTGQIFGVNYTETATLTTNVAVGALDAQVAVANGQYTTTASNVTANLTGVSLSFSSSVITAFTSLFQSSIIPEIEDAIATVVADAFPPALDSFLNDIPQMLSLAPTVDVAFDFVPELVTFAPGSFTLRMAAGAHPLVIDSIAVPLTRYYSTSALPPAFGSTVPGTSTPFTTGLTLEDDMLNQALTALVRSGTLDFDYSATLNVLGQPLAINCGNMALIFPGLGFEKFAPNAAALLRIHPAIAPVVRVGSTTGDMMEMSLSDLLVDLVAKPSPSQEIVVASIGIVGTVGLNVSLNLVAGTLNVTAGAVSSQAYTRFTMPGVDASSVVSSVPFLLPAIVPALISGLGAIPVPDISGTGIGTNVLGIVPQGQFVSVFAN